MVQTAMYREQADGSLVTPFGLLQKVSALLNNMNIPWVFEDFTESKLAEPAYGNVDPLRPGQDDILACIIANPYGVIEAPTGAGKSFIIRQIPKLWPGGKIIIASYASGIVRQTYAELKPAFRLGEVGMVGDGYDEREARILCVVDRSLMKCSLEQCDIFIYDEVHRAASKCCSEAISRISDARRYGFSASPYGRSDGADMETEGMFGPTILKVSYQEVQAVGSVVPIDVYMLPVNGQPIIHESTLEMKRLGLWSNEERNRSLKWAVEWAFKTFGEDIQMLITVETCEHALRLAHLLPSFTVVYASLDARLQKRFQREGILAQDFDALTPDKREELRVQFSNGDLKRVIATSVWGTGMDFKYLNVLVRADAAGGEIPNTQLPGRVTRISKDKDVGIVIDCIDFFDKTLEGRSSRRMSFYKKKGWTINHLQPPTYIVS